MMIVGAHNTVYVRCMWEVLPYLLLYNLWEDATENDPSQVKRLSLCEHGECAK